MVANADLKTAEEQSDPDARPLFIVGPKLITRRAASVGRHQYELRVPVLALPGPAADDQVVKMAGLAAELSPEIFEGD